MREKVFFFCPYVNFPSLLGAADWIIADMLAVRQDALGHVRYVLKDGLKWLPLYGWYFSQVIHRICALHA